MKIMMMHNICQLYKQILQLEYFSSQLMTFDPRFSVSYQIPYQPLIDSTKQEIERSLFSLEQKLRRRKYIDMETQLQEEASTAKLLSSQANYLDNLRNLQQKQAIYHTLSQQNMYRQQFRSQIEHARRLQQLRIQRDTLNRQRGIGLQRPYQYLQAKPVASASYFQQNDDQELIKRYQNGSKAKEYYQDLKNQKFINQNKNKIQDLMVPAILNNFYTQKKKLGSNYQNYATDAKRNQIYSTPYDIVKHSQQTKIKRPLQGVAQQINEQPIKSVNKDHDSSVQQLKSSRKQFQPNKDLTNKNKSKSTVKLSYNSRSPNQNTSNKFNQTSSPFKSLSKFNSLSKLPRHPSRSNLSPHKTNTSYDEYLEARGQLKKELKPKVEYIQANALKKIENRLKLSRVMYEDSQFRNKKYQINHLFNTFDMQLKQRNEIRDKINSHPYILRKHPLVID